MTRILAFAGMAALSLAAASAQTSNPTQSPDLDTQLRALTSAPAVSRAHWGIMVTALDGTPLASLNEAQLFQPASNAKLYTTAAAMALLGPDQRFTTRLEYGSAGQSSPTVHGDLVLIGSGDGTFGDPNIPYREPSPGTAAATSPPPPTFPELAAFADQVAASGVRRITGNIVGDDTVFPWQPYPEDWAADDLIWGYGAPVSGLTLADNQIRVVVHPGRSVTEKPAVDVPHNIPAYYTFDLTGLVTGPARSGNHVQMERAPGAKVIRVYGSIATDAAPDAEELAITDPAEFAAQVLKQMLEARGIQVDGRAVARHRLLDNGAGFVEESREPLPALPTNPVKLGTEVHFCLDDCPSVLEHSSSFSVSADVVLTNKASQNLHAELLLLHLGEAYGAHSLRADGVHSLTAQGVRVVRQFLINAGIDPHDFVFFDGSGLSGHDLTTPRATARLLSYAVHDPANGQPQPWFAQWKASLPIGGVDGSLESRFKDPPLKGHVFAKTGTLGEARALSGYLDTASGRTVIFSIMVNAYVPGTSAIRETMDQIVSTIASTL